jgi:hypothetical protein
MRFLERSTDSRPSGVVHDKASGGGDDDSSPVGLGERRLLEVTVAGDS